jgi:hypothetical protein
MQCNKIKKSKIIGVALTEKIVSKWNTQQDATDENKKIKTQGNISAVVYRIILKNGYT